MKLSSRTLYPGLVFVSVFLPPSNSAIPGVTPSLSLLLVPPLLRMLVICPEVAAVCHERKSTGPTGVRITSLHPSSVILLAGFGDALHLPEPQLSHLLMGVIVWAYSFMWDCGEVHMGYKL